MSSFEKGGRVVGEFHMLASIQISYFNTAVQCRPGTVEKGLRTLFLEWTAM